MANRDITYCAAECGCTDCFRHISHTSEGFFSFSDLRCTELCPRNKEYYTTIPADCFGRITREFCMDFLAELDRVFKGKFSAHPLVISELAGTVGWNIAFETVCFTHDLPELVYAAKTMQHFDYDVFAEELTLLCLHWEDVYAA